MSTKTRKMKVAKIGEEYDYNISSTNILVSPKAQNSMFISYNPTTVMLSQRETVPTPKRKIIFSWQHKQHGFNTKNIHVTPKFIT